MKEFFKSMFVVTLLSLLLISIDRVYADSTYTLEENDYVGDYAFRFTSDKYVAFSEKVGTNYTYLLSTHYFTLNGTLAFCVEPGIPSATGVKYRVSTDYTANTDVMKSSAYSAENLLKISYMIGQIEKSSKAYYWQVVKMALYCIISEEGTYSVGYTPILSQTSANAQELKLSDIDDLLESANTAYDNSNGEYILDGTVCNPTFSTSSLTFSYDSSLDAYVSNSVTLTVEGNKSSTISISGAPEGSYILAGNTNKGTSYSQSVTDGVTLKVVVPRTSFTGSQKITLTATGSGSAVKYTPATLYRAYASDNDFSKYSTDSGADPTQVMVTANYTTIKGTNVTASGTANRKVGNLKIEKKDENGKNVNITFKIKQTSGDGTDYFSEYSVTTSNGVATIEDLDIGTYEITETSIAEELTLSSETFSVTAEENQTVTFTITNNYKRGSAQLHKYDLDYSRNLKGDATLEGITYGIYAAEDIYEGETLMFSSGELIISVETDENGDTPKVDSVYSTQTQKTLDGLPIGKYYWQEIKTNSSYVYSDEKTEFSIVNNTDKYNEDLGLVEVDADNKVVLGRVWVYKYDNDSENEEYDTDKNSAYGAVLRLRLVSAIGTDEEERNTYYATIDENGYAEFFDDEYLAMYPDAIYTIPYGYYVIDETEASQSGKTTYFYIQEEYVDIEKNEDEEQRIVADEPVPAYLKIVKYDSDTQEIVQLAGATFKIWSVDDDDWVTFYTQYQEITELHITTDDGYLVTPQQLQPGTYVVYEISAPDGYYLEDSLRLPEDESNLGNTEYGGAEVVIDKLATGHTADATYPEGGDTSNLVVELDISDRPLKAQIQIYKTGEVLISSTSSNTDYGEKYTPVWEEKGLEGVTFDIVATEDIMSPDGTVTYVKAGTVVDTVTTGEDGYATTDELYLGTYSIVETDTPDGYIIDDDIEDVTLKNDNELVRVELEKKELTNTRQKLELTFKKIFDEVTYIVDETEPTAVFGVYTNEDIKNYNSSVIISKDSLVDVITVTGNGEYATSTIDLPEGSYYVKELEVSYPYTISDNVQNFTLKYDSDSTREFVVVEGEDVENTAQTGSITLIKLSSSTVDSVMLYGSVLDTSELDEKIAQIIDDIAGLTKVEISNYLLENNIKFVAGATYKVYTDEECTTVLKVLNETTGKYEEVTFETDESGMITIDGIPAGTYYFKEVSAPRGYTISEEAVKVTITSAELDATIYQALIDDGVLGYVITKTDIFTGDVVPDCTFEITDEEGNVLVHAVTDENGDAYIPVDLFEDGKTYYYTEIDAPDIYELNTEAHEFVAQIDEETGEWIAEPIEVENIRKTSTVTLTKLDLMDSTPIPNCKFELRSLETDFVVEGVTDENGIYVFENIPYGVYTYTELEAPEEYQIDTTPHEITIDAEEITIQVTNQLVDTSDIQVLTLSIVLVVSILGVAYTLRKKKITN